MMFARQLIEGMPDWIAIPGFIVLWLLAVVGTEVIKKWLKK